MKPAAGLALAGLLALGWGGEAKAQRLLHAGAFWAALERPGGTCEAVARSELIASPVRPGAAAVLTVGAENFLLVTRGTSAWSRDPRQSAAIIAAVRRSAEMRVRAQGQGGRISDRYLLAGAPTAIDAAAIGCA